MREVERKLKLQNEEIKMKVLERDNMVRELESALEHLKFQCDYMDADLTMFGLSVLFCE